MHDDRQGVSCVEHTKNKSPASAVLGIYLLCFFFRMIEYMVIRTDQSVIGEAFIPKSVAIIIIAIAIRYLHLISAFKRRTGSSMLLRD